MKKLNSLISILYFSLCGLGAVNINAAEICRDTLGQELNKLPTWMKEESHFPLGLPKSCIKRSMNVFRSWAQTLGHDPKKNEGLFIFCQEDSYQKTPIPQCQTDAYMNATTNSYNAVTDCLGIEDEDFYPIISAESGYYHNAISFTEADFGFGQVTHPAIIDVNATWYGHLEEMKNSKKRSCQRILDFIQAKDITPVEDDYRCNLTKTPKNPLLNALYAGLHFKMITSYLEDHIKQTHLQSKVENLLGKNFTLDRFKKVKSLLLMLSYNMGHGGMTQAFEDYLKEQMVLLEGFQKEKRELTRELAVLNFRLRKSGGEPSVLKKKESLIKELQELDWTIAWVRDPKRLYADQSAYSFGEYLSKTNRSHYLKILNRRVEYLSKFDKEKECPSSELFHIL